MTEQDGFEDILARCVRRVESEGPHALDSMCETHPEHADRLRAYIGRLRGMNLVDDEAPADDPVTEPAPPGPAHADDRPERIGPFRILDTLGSPSKRC